MPDDVVLRLYRALVRELRRRGHPVGDPVKVADLYEELVPYRAVRARLGVDLSADYEDALLRLLAGEHGLVRLEPDDARDELRREAATPYPTVGLFRKFSASDVWLVTPESDVDLEPESTAGPRAHPDPSQGHRSAATVGQASPDRDAVQVTGGIDPADRTPPEAAPRPTCGFCGRSLPEGASLRFCPYCGEDQASRPCPECGGALHEEWRFCAHCGVEVAGLP